MWFQLAECRDDIFVKRLLYHIFKEAHFTELNIWEFLNYHDNRGLSFLFCEVKVRRAIYLEKKTNFKIVRNLVTNSSKFYKQYSHTCRNCKMMIFMHRYSKIFSLAGHFCFRKIKSYII